MGQWKSKPTPHAHDLLKPRKLEQESALPGWVWTCACNFDFELVSYQTGATASATWKDVAAQKIFTINYKDDAVPSKT